MFNDIELTTLYRGLRDTHVLSVYIDGSTADLAAQHGWRTQVERQLKDIRTRLARAPRDERDEFERCVAALRERLASFTHTVRAPGWVAFITNEGVHEAHPVRVPVPTLAVWSIGPRIAPYVRALKEARPVVVAIADARSTVVHHYQFGELHRIETIRAKRVVGEVLHMGSGPTRGFHTGTRGVTGHDAGQRAMLEGRDRMLDEAAHDIANAAAPDGWIVLGGIHRVAARLAVRLVPIAMHRVVELRSLDIHATDAQIAAAARGAASEQRRSFDDRQVTDIVERAGAHGLGVVGPKDTQRALDERRVRALYITSHSFQEDAVDTEAAVRAALDQGASVEEVSGPGAVKLDEVGGIAAGLRFCV